MLSLSKVADEAVGSTLADLVKGSGGVVLMDRDVMVSRNLGYPTIILNVPIYELLRISTVANVDEQPNDEEVAQRRLDPKHAFKLAQFMLKGLVQAAASAAGANHPLAPTFARIIHTLVEQPYAAIQPIVANIRTAG